MKEYPRYIVSLLLVAFSQTCAAQHDVERAVCGRFLEPILFSLWSSQAERRVEPVPDWPHLEHLTVTVRDGTEIKGFRLKSRSSDGKLKASLLVVQGNAMLAQNLLPVFNPFSQIGFDVYIFDFRGYGLSGGKPRFKAIVDDYKELLQFVSKSGGAHVQYGMSFGGVVLLSANKTSAPPSRLVIDSSPSVVSNQGCPTIYDPVNTLSANAANVAIIVGGNDKIVSPNSSRALVDLVKSRGGTVIKRESWVHPLMENSAEARSERLETIQTLLLERSAEEKK